MRPEAQTSGYDRLGGVYSIATVVDGLVDRMMTDPRLNANPLVDVYASVLQGGQVHRGDSVILE